MRRPDARAQAPGRVGRTRSLNPTDVAADKLLHSAAPPYGSGGGALALLRSLVRTHSRGYGGGVRPASRTPTTVSFNTDSGRDSRRLSTSAKCHVWTSGNRGR